MKIFNEDKTIELEKEQCDLSLGYFDKDTLDHIVPEQQDIKEVGHYETIREYDNGGKDVEWIVEVAGQEYVPEHTEIEEILVYRLYTQQELNQQRINDLKYQLDETDYQAIKFAEGAMTEEEYAPMREQRQEWRDEINRLKEENEQL